MTTMKGSEIVRTGNFFETSQQIVKDFLNNVVAIDDRLFFSPSPMVSKPASNDADNDFLFDDVENDMNDDSGLGVVEANDVQVNPINLFSEDHSLDYQDLSLSFAEYGINCSGFIPDPARFSTLDDAADKIVFSASRADVTILDWRMDEKFSAEIGSLAKSCIKKILKKDKEQFGRLRLIVIYTAEPDLDDIALKIVESLTMEGINANLKNKEVVFCEPDLAYCKISVIEKKVHANDLREEVIALFTELTIGLLPNATLSTLSEIRDKTHHILHTFNKDLDSAYLSHIIGLLSSPKVRENADEVALDYAAELIAEELKSIIQISAPLKSSLKKERIKNWLSHINNLNQSDFFDIIIGSKSSQVGTEQIINLLDATSHKAIGQILSTPPLSIHETSTGAAKIFEEERIQVNIKGGGIDSNEKLSIIECKRRDGRSLINNLYSPNIKLGSIIRKDDEYFICLQPLCDSVRLSCDTSFLFLAVEVVNKPHGRFSYVIQSQSGESIKLIARPTSRCIRKFILTPDATTRTVKVEKNQDSNDYILYYKKDDQSSGCLKWIGELKSTIAQSISNSVAASISRVGLDTNEWLRLSSQSRMG